MTATPTYKSIVYHTDWANYARNFQVKDLEPFLPGITDIAYAFFNLQDSGGGNYVIAPGDIWADFQNPFIGDGVDPQNTSTSPTQDLGLLGQFTKLYTATNGEFRLQLAIGGWTFSTNFSLAVRTSSSRSSLAQSIVALFQQWPVFTGVSIDWEYLSNNGVNYGNTGNVVDPSDSANFVLFVQTLRELFNQNNWTKYTIALCCTSAPEKIQFDVASLIPLLDEWHVMTYDFADGSWTNVTGHQSNLMPSPYSPYSASGAVQAYIQKGVPASRIFMGVPFYSRGFSGTTGLGSTATGPSPDMSWQPGVADYKALPEPHAVEGWDDVAQAGFSYDATRKVLDTYDVPGAVKAKCEYVIQNGLGGLIIWESSADAPYGSARSLLTVIHDNLLTQNPSHTAGPPLPSGAGPVVTLTPTPQAPAPVTPSPPKGPAPVTQAQPWSATTYYNVGDIVSYQGNLYQCTIAHQAQAAWTPTEAPSLWREIPSQ